MHPGRAIRAIAEKKPERVVCLDEGFAGNDQLKANAVQIFFRDGSATEKVEVEYPVGHRRRRAEGIPVLQQKARAAFAAHYGPDKAGRLMALFSDRAKLEAMPVHEFTSAFSK